VIGFREHDRAAIIARYVPDLNTLSQLSGGSRMAELEVVEKPSVAAKRAAARPAELAGPKAPTKRLSFFAALAAMKDNPLATIPVIAYEQPIWEAKSMFGNQLVVSDPAGIKRILLDNVAGYPKTALDVRILSTAFGDGLLSSDGEIWRAHRRVMSPSFDHRSIASYAPVITDAAAARLEAWDAKGENAEVDIAREMVALTLEVISRTMFSADSDALRSRLDETIRKATIELSFGLQHIAPLIGPFLLNRKLARVRANFEALDAVMQKLIRGRETHAGAAPKDLLDRLIAATDSETGFRMTDEEVRDEVIIIFLAGHDTSALAATYVWYLLSLHPEEEAKLHAELDAVLGGRVPTYDDLEKLSYTRMVIDEAMRLYPPAPALTGRVARERDEICGRPIRKGTEIVILPWVLHRHRTLWDDPDRFDPERFSRERSTTRPRFAYLPFGGGPRICIGAQLALTEVSLLVATIAQRYRLKLVPRQNIVLLHRVTLRPRDGIRMRLERRN
jgi:cytochrome P450